MLGMTDLMVGQDSMLAAMEEECAARSWGPCCWRTLERAACPTAKGGEIACITTSIFVQVPPHHPLQHPLIRTLLQPPLRFAPRIHTSHSHYTFTRARLCTASCATTRTACSAAGRWECRCMTRPADVQQRASHAPRYRLLLGIMIGGTAKPRAV